MGMQRTQGFTILETMLFLGVTGLLIIGTLVGIGASLNVQRYRDGVQSLKSLVQDQYSQTKDVVNDHNNSWKCAANAQVSQGGANSGTERGQSNCVLLGRYMIINQSTVSIQNVVGNQVASTTVGTDIQLLKANYVVALNSSSATTSTLEWGAKIAWPQSGTGSQPSGTARSIGILLVQSPDSGITYTFTVDTPKDMTATSGTDLFNMMVTGNNVSQLIGSATIRGQDQRTICIDPSTFTGFSGTAIYLDAYATNSTAIETQTNEILQQTQGNGAPQC